MEEFFNNKYVVHVGRAHPGSTMYTVLSTREHMNAMVLALLEALAKPEDSLRGSLQPVESPTTLWSNYATTAYGQTSRVTLAFQIVRDLAPFHVRRTITQRVGGVASGLLILLVLA